MEKLEEVRMEGASCDLPADELGDRIAAWKDLGREALTRTASEGRILTTYPSTVRDRLTYLIEAEAQCCPFLVFDVREVGETLEVEVTYPPEFGAMVSTVVG